MLLKRTGKGAAAGQSKAGVDSADDDGFTPHPGGISSLFFAFADLIIHSCFYTDHADWSVNKTSSYLDLSPLYGNSEADIAKARNYFLFVFLLGY
jgi:hypothetical protein